jgi:hypothetical protein
MRMPTVPHMASELANLMHNSEAEGSYSTAIKIGSSQVEKDNKKSIVV